MTEAKVQVLADEARFGHRVRWERGPSSETRDLRPDASLEGGALVDSVANLHRLPEDALAALGRHLWQALSPPEDEAADGLCLVSDDPEVLALPWHLLARAGNWLALEGVAVRVEALGAPSATHLARDLRVLVALSSDPDEALAWDNDLSQLTGGQPAVEFVPEPSAILEALGGRDVVCLPVHPDAAGGGDDGPLELDSGPVELPALEAALADHAPRLLLLEAVGHITFDLVRKAARLARFAPCVTLLGDPTRQDFVPPGSQSRRLLRRMYEEGLSPAAACQRIATTGAAPAAWPRSFGGALPPRPRKLPGWLQDDSWRLTLDRRQQTAMARGFIQAMVETRGMDSGLALFWHGARGSGLGRLHHRLRHVLRKNTHACQVLEPGWPLSGFMAEDFAGLYEAELGLDSLELADPDELARALAHRYDALPSGGGQILYVDHGVLPVEWSVRTDALTILGDYLEWWACTFVPGVPERLAPVLAIAVEAGEVEADLWDARLREKVEALRGTILPVRAEVLPVLPDVTEIDVLEFIHMYGLDIPRKYRQRVAAELVETTRGRYEETVREIELLPWRWRDWVRKGR